MGKKSRRNRPGGSKTQGDKNVPTTALATSVGLSASLCRRLGLDDDINDLQTRRSRANQHKMSFIRLSDESAGGDDLEAHRMLELIKYGCCLANENGNITTKKDYNFLKSICKSTIAADAGPAVRAQAFVFTIGFKIMNMELEDALQCSYNAVQLYEKIKNDRRFPGLLEYLVQMKQVCEVLMTNVKTVTLEYGQGNTKKIQLMGGQECDSCGKRANEVGVVNDLLDCCGRCQMTFYCSEECQRAHWKKSHKRQCRKKGEFRVGDFAYCCGYNITGVQEVFRGEVVELIKWEEETSTWYVAYDKHTLNDHEIKKNWVHTKDLRRCRPAVWKDLAQASTWTQPTNHVFTYV